MLIHRFDPLNPSAIHTDSAALTTKWSNNRISIRVKAAFSRTVSARSAAEGSMLPLGWLWASKTADAFNARARRTTTHG
jgi:hypothetical protein